MLSASEGAPANGPVALVTGASSGIGEATARLLAARYGAKLVLVARREARLRELAEQIGSSATWVAADLTADGAPARVRDHVAERHGRIDVLVNNAGGSWRARFAEGGYENVRRTMELNFDAPVRLTDALLPLLRESAPSAIVNVASTAARVARAGAVAYSASKAALVAWSDGLHVEEKAAGVHVGTVLPGFIETEGFPAAELRERALTRWLVSKPETVAEVIAAVAFERHPERYVPRYYAIAALTRVTAPRLLLRALAHGGAAAFTTRTAADD